MHIIGIGATDNLVITATAAELLLILGKTGPVVAGMFKAGQQIDVGEQWQKLQTVAGQQEKMTKLAVELKASAAAIEIAIGDRK